MISKEITVKVMGHVEESPVAKLVQIANKYDSRIYFESDNRHINGKSMMGMMTLALYNDEDVVVSAEGPDEADAVLELEAYLTMSE